MAVSFKGRDLTEEEDLLLVDRTNEEFTYRYTVKASEVQKRILPSPSWKKSSTLTLRLERIEFETSSLLKLCGTPFS